MKPFVSKHRLPFGTIKPSLGFSMLVVVLVISTLAFLIAFQATVTSLQEEQTRLRDRHGRETFYLTQGCLEEALLSLKQDPGYSGGSLIIDSVLCEIIVTGGETRTLTIRATQGTDYNREMQADVRLSPDFSILRWRELPLAL